MENFTKSNIKIGEKDFPVRLSKDESLQDCLSMICIEQAFTIHNKKAHSENAVTDILDTLESELAK